MERVAGVPAGMPSASGSVTPLADAGTAAAIASQPEGGSTESARSAAPRNPIEAVARPEQELPPVAESDARVDRALDELPAVKRGFGMLQLDGFVRRATATVDNLGRRYASTRLWPVHPMPGRFTVAEPGAAETTIAPENTLRYQAFVAFAESVPLDAAVRLYARLYPLFQSAYEDLGYPHGYFNDRLVSVLSLLLATPTPAGPIRVELTQIKGEFTSTQPWLRYEYADPELQLLTSGQKMLVRMGPANARRLKAVLAKVRNRVATGAMVSQESH